MRKALTKNALDRIINDYHKIIKIKSILSDHGTQFTAKLWQDRLKKEGINVCLSSIRHPASNPSERVMRELGRIFRTFCNKSHVSWANYVTDIENLFNSTPHLSTGFSAYEILYGSNPSNKFTKLFDKYLLPPTRLSLTEIRDKAFDCLKEHAILRKNKHLKHDQFLTGDYVLLRENPISDATAKISQKLCLLYSGPYIIIDIPHCNVYTLANPDDLNNIKGRYNITNLKLYYRST